MRLSEIRALIRKTSGNPTARIDLGNGVPMTITMQKTPLLAALGEAFKNERTAETGLTFDADTSVLSADAYETIACPTVASDDEDEFDMVDGPASDFDDEDDDDML